MTDPTLIADLESAEGTPEEIRRLSNEIWAAMKGFTTRQKDGKQQVLVAPCYCANHPAGQPHWQDFGSGANGTLSPPLYAGSLDAALTLVSEGVLIRLGQDDNGKWNVELRQRRGDLFHVIAICGRIESAALAVCAAALQVRA